MDDQLLNGLVSPDDGASDHDEPNLDSPSEQLEDTDPSQSGSERETFEWGGRNLTAQEMYEEARTMQKAFTQKSQEAAELRKLAEKIDGLQAAQQKADDPTAKLSEEERRNLENAANMLSPYMESFIDQKVEARAREIAQAELTNTLTQREQRAQLQQQFSEAEKLSKEWGVKYDQNALIDHIQKTGNTNVVSALKDMNEAAYLDYMIKQRQSKKRPLETQKGTSTPKQSPEPEFKSVTDSNFKSSLAEKLRRMTSGA